MGDSIVWEVVKTVLPFFTLIIGFFLKTLWGYFSKNIEETDTRIETSITNIFEEMKKVTKSLSDLVSQFKVAQKGDEARDEKIGKLDKSVYNIEKRVRELEIKVQ